MGEEGEGWEMGVREWGLGGAPQPSTSSALFLTNHPTPAEPQVSGNLLLQHKSPRKLHSRNRRKSLILLRNLQFSSWRHNWPLLLRAAAGARVEEAGHLSQ